MSGSLSWIDDFFGAIAPYVFWRKEDAVLILPPNRVYKANTTGAALIEHLKRGNRVESFPGLVGPGRRADVEDFFLTLKAVYEETNGGDRRPDVVPYDFDFTRLPVLGEIAVTYRCNNFCRFCYAGADFIPAPDARGRRLSGAAARVSRPEAAASQTGPALASGGEMTLAEAKRIILAFRERAKVPFFSFTGGEPLMRKDLEAMIRYAVRLGLRVNLITNGTLATPERARSLYRSGLRTAQVSLESPDPETHDALTQVTGAWERTMAGIAALRAAGLSVQTNTTITAENLGKAAAMPDFLASIGIERFSMNLFIPTGRGGTADGLFVPYAKIGPVVDSVRKAAFARNLTFYWYSPTPHCLFNPIARGMGNKSCAAVDGLVSVNPRGEILPCSSWNEPLGSLLTGDFDEIWFSERALHFKHKEKAPALCAGCSRFVACQGACPLYWRWAGEGELASAAGGPGCEAARPQAEAVPAVS